MKVGVFLGEYQPEDGGGFTFQQEIVEALARLANESRHTFVLISSYTKQLKERVKGTPLRVMIYRPPNLFQKIVTRLGRSFTFSRRSSLLRSNLDKDANSEGIDFIWFTHPRTITTDIPYMTIVWDLQHRLQPWFPEVSAQGEWLSREGGLPSFLQRASRVIVGTHTGKKEVQLFYGIPNENFVLLPHPTPGYALLAETVSREVLARFTIPDPYVVYPAQFWAHKNHVLILDALVKLKKEHALDIHAVFVGSDKGNRSYIEKKAARVGLSGQVHFPGFVSQQELIALYQHALALTYVSLFGPENLPPLEAFGLGCPVIATNVPGAEEQIGEAGLLVNTLDANGLVEALLRIAKDHDFRKELIARGRQRASRSSTDNFLRGVFKALDEFEPFRRTWGNDQGDA